MSVKWIIDKFGIGRTREGQEKQFPGYEAEILKRSQLVQVMNLKPLWNPSYWHSGNTMEDLSGFKKD